MLGNPSAASREARAPVRRWRTSAHAPTPPRDAARRGSIEIRVTPCAAECTFRGALRAAAGGAPASSSAALAALRGGELLGVAATARPARARSSAAMPVARARCGTGGGAGALGGGAFEVHA